MLDAKIPKIFGGGRKRTTLQIAFEESYGFRGRDLKVYYLNAWEFTSLWRIEFLKQPSSYMGAAEAMTVWTEEGLIYWETNRSEPLADAPTPGEHYVVVEPTIYAN